MKTAAIAALLLLWGSAAHAEVLYPSRKLGGYFIQIATLDPSRSWVSIQVMDKNGNPLSPGSVPLNAEYAARNVPFTSLPLEARGMEMVGHVSSPETEPYTIRLKVKSGNTTFNPRFFIQRPLTAGTQQ